MNAFPGCHKVSMSDAHCLSAEMQRDEISPVLGLLEHPGDCLRKEGEVLFDDVPDA